MLKKPSDKKPLRSTATEEQADMLARRLADKGYGDTEHKVDVQESMARTSISLPVTLLRQLEDKALENKRSGNDLKSVSSLVRAALEKYLNA